MYSHPCKMLKSSARAQMHRLRPCLSLRRAACPPRIWDAIPYNSCTADLAEKVRQFLQSMPPNWPLWWLVETRLLESDEARCAVTLVHACPPESEFLNPKGAPVQKLWPGWTYLQCSRSDLEKVSLMFGEGPRTPLPKIAGSEADACPLSLDPFCLPPIGWHPFPPFSVDPARAGGVCGCRPRLPEGLPA